MTKSPALKIALIFLFSVFLFLILNNYSSPDSSLAYETSCPSSMSNEECLDFLNEQAALISAEKKEVESSLESEVAQQETLSQQINYLSYTIKNTELTILELEVEIAKANAEINILGDQIHEIQNNVDTLTQEINILQEAITERTKIGYKLSLISPVEIILDSNNFESMLRRIKYLISAKAKDREVLSGMSASRNELKSEENKLSEKRSEEQEKRNEIEENREDLARQRDNLAQQKAQQQVLLAQSEQRLAEYEKLLSSLQAQQAAVEKQVTDLIMMLFQSGQLGVGTPVSRGAIVGFQGHTGCSLGSHLHFEIRKNGYNINPCSTGYLTGGLLYNPIGSGSAHAPLDGGYLTQTYWSGHLALDIVSYSYGDQSGDYYYKDKGEVSCPSWFPINNYLPAWLPLRGEGAPVRAILSGTVYRSTADSYGGKYVLIDHGNGLTSMYLHLR